MFELQRLTHLLSGCDMRLVGDVLVKKGNNSHITYEDKDKIEKILGCKTYQDFAGQLGSTSKIVLIKSDEQRTRILQNKMFGEPSSPEDRREVREKMREGKYGFTEKELEKINNAYK